MKFFSKLFGSKQTNSNNIVQATETNTHEAMPDNLFRDLFADTQQPTSSNASTMKNNRLQDFLGADYNAKGFSDGYEYHSTELLEHKIHIFKAEFRQILDETIDQRKQDVFLLRNQLIETRGLSERLIEQIELRIAEFKDVIAKLQREKEFSVEDEGLVMKTIHQYREGYLRGCRDWHEVKLFAQSTGLF